MGNLQPDEIQLISKEDLLQRWNQTTETSLRDLAFRGLLQSYNGQKELMWYRIWGIRSFTEKREYTDQASFDIVWPAVAFFDLPSVEDFERRRHLKPGALKPKIDPAVPQPVDVNDYIEAQRSENKSDEEIAYNLHEPPCKLTYYSIIKAMGLDDGTNREANSITQQGKRLCDRWKKTLQKPPAK